MTLTDIDRRALALLRRGSYTAGHLGKALWGRGGLKPQHYARSAAKLLQRLERRGLVRSWKVSSGSTLYAIERDADEQQTLKWID